MHGSWTHLDGLQKYNESFPQFQEGRKIQQLTQNFSSGVPYHKQLMKKKTEKTKAQ